MRDASICGLGQAASNPLTSVMRYFPEFAGGCSDAPCKRWNLSRRRIDLARLSSGTSVFLAGRDPRPDLVGDPDGHSVLRFLVAKLRQKRIVVAAAEDDEFFTSISVCNKLRLHGLPILAVNVPAVSHREDFEAIGCSHRR